MIASHSLALIGLPFLFLGAIAIYRRCGGRTNSLSLNLTDAALQERRRDVLQKVRNAVIETRELEDGYSYQLPASEEWLAELVQLVNLERQCCPFLRLSITVEPDNGPFWLELTGAAGTKDFLASTFN
ncbi:MAG TPA: hypothetical protein VJ023_14590 [Pyrinomonadaceae bacterium]|nr:hypothetical protein [Pyrinomonadaceae bacterium]